MTRSTGSDLTVSSIAGVGGVRSTSGRSGLATAFLQQPHADDSVYNLDPEPVSDAGQQHNAYKELQQLRPSCRPLGVPGRCRSRRLLRMTVSFAAISLRPKMGLRFPAAVGAQPGGPAALIGGVSSLGGCWWRWAAW